MAVFISPALLYHKSERGEDRFSSTSVPPPVFEAEAVIFRKRVYDD